MKTWINLLVVFLILISSSCKKEQEYVKGYVLAGVKDTVSIESVFNLMDSLDLSMEEADGFYFVSSLPEDSVNYLIKLLNAKPYFNTQQFQAYCEYYPSEPGVIIFVKFFNMNRANQQDWLKTSEQLQLRAWTKSIAKDVVLKVPEGSEKEWVNKLKGNPMFRWVELNDILHFTH